jgi:hypothetical protein
MSEVYPYESVEDKSLTISDIVIELLTISRWRQNWQLDVKPHWIASRARIVNEIVNNITKIPELETKNIHDH